MKFIITIILFSIAGCVTNNKSTNKASDKTKANTETEFSPQFTAGPPTIVYKTSSNYNNLVPILLSDDKTQIVSYPHPSDLKNGVTYLIPTYLNEGYLLDNKGINKDIAFLKLTYEEYSRLPNAPTLNELYNLIIDKNPLTEMCDCGNKNAFINIESQLNSLINNKVLRTKCKIIK